MGGFFLLGAVVVARLLVSQPSSSALIPIPATYGFIASVGADGGNGANPAGILVHESEEPANEVITDDIFEGILLVCGAYAWFKWCNGKSGENENDDDGPVERVISKKPEP